MPHRMDIYIALLRSYHFFCNIFMVKHLDRYIAHSMGHVHVYKTLLVCGKTVEVLRSDNFTHNF